jgi:putative transposase
MSESITEYAHFFTATNLEWRPLLAADKYKGVVIESMQFLVNDKRVIIYDFVIMPNHLHLIWQMRAGILRENVQRDFLKHTAQTIKVDLIRNHKEDLQH